MNLERPALWQRRPDEAIGMLNVLTSKMPVPDARGPASLVCACAAGWTAAFSPPEDVIARVAALVLAYHTGVTVDGARVVVPAIQAVAAQHDVDPMPYLRRHLIGVLTDPTDRFEMATDQATEIVEAALHAFL